MDNELTNYLQDMEARTNKRFDETIETIRGVETKLLAEFWKWSRTSDLRTRQALNDASTLGERMIVVEERITDLERGSKA